MKRNEFIAGLDEIEIDPRPKLKRCVDSLIDVELRCHGLSDDQIERFSATPLQNLFANAKAAIKQGNFSELDKHITDFDLAIRQRVMREREAGELRPVTPQNQIKDNLQTFTARHYKGMDLGSIRVLMQPGEKIVKIDWWDVETDRQVIRRADLPKVGRPLSWHDGNAWRKQFTSDAEVQAAIDAERGRPITAQRHTPWSD